MEPLLIVFVVGCACVSALHMGRGFWARSRSVERHHQALDTLGDITQRPDLGPAPGFEPQALLNGHQAHVRIIGPEGTSSPAPVLSPPRPSLSPGARRPSPFRRPSRSAPSLASMDAVAASTALRGSPNSRLLRTGLQPPGLGPGDGGGDHTLPGGTPPERPLPMDERSTRPVPVARAQVFYFDDMGVKPAGAKPAGAEPARPATTTATATARRWRPRSWPKSAVASGLAAAAVCVALVAAGLSLDNGKGARAATREPATRAHSSSPKKATSKGGTHVAKKAKKTAPAVSTPTVPARAAALVSSSAGAATYHISSSMDSIVVSAHGPCWIEVKASTASGRVVYEGTLQAGGRYPVRGPAWIRLGDPPEVSVMVDGDRLGPPGAALGAPLNLQFTLH